MDFFFCLFAFNKPLKWLNANKAVSKHWNNVLGPPWISVWYSFSFLQFNVAAADVLYFRNTKSLHLHDLLCFFNDLPARSERPCSGWGACWEADCWMTELVLQLTWCFLELNTFWFTNKIRENRTNDERKLFVRKNDCHIFLSPSFVLIFYNLVNMFFTVFLSLFWYLKAIKTPLCINSY